MIEPRDDLRFGQVKDEFDRHVQMEACCAADYFAEEDRCTLELWNYFRPYAGLRALEVAVPEWLGCSAGVSLEIKRRAKMLGRVSAGRSSLFELASYWGCCTWK